MRGINSFTLRIMDESVKQSRAPDKSAIEII